MSIAETLRGFREGEREIKCPCPFDVAIVLGGGLRLFNDEFTSTSYQEGTEKAFGGIGRVVAAAIFYHLGLAPHFIVSTGKTHSHPDAPSEATVMRTELIDYGVPESCITVEDKSLNTLENAIEVAKILRTDTFKQAEQLALISNSYHLRRSLTFFDAQGLTAEGRHITPISCDRVIYEIIPELRQYMIDLYNSPSMKARIKREAQGVRDFHAKHYKSKPPQ